MQNEMLYFDLNSEKLMLTTKDSLFCLFSSQAFLNFNLFCMFTGLTVIIKIKKICKTSAQSWTTKLQHKVAIAQQKFNSEILRIRCIAWKITHARTLS